MSSSMLAGERKWSSSRRGGMTVLGKVAVPKPINLPSQKLENHGLDPNVEIVPKGSLSWGSRPSSSTSNPWGSSSASPNADGTTASPHHPSGRPTSSGGLSRPSTAGSDRHDHSASTWGPNSRPSSASGVLTSNQTPLTSRPLSADTRPGSSHLSRFAEPAYDNSGAWGPNGTADKLSIPSKVNDFSLSSGDFPTLGSEKDNTTKSGEPHDHGAHVRPGSGSGRIAPVKDEHKSGTVDTWTRDGSSHFDEGVRHNAVNWQRDPHQYGNPNVPPQHYDAWQGPPMNGPPPGVWYRGPPPAGPPYPHVPHGGYPMEPYPYYRPQMPPPLSNSQSGPPPGPGPRGHHPRNGDFYRPQMPDAFIRPGMPMRPGFYPGPVPYDGYYGPPMGYNHNDRDMPYMGMPPGPHGPPVYNLRPPQNPSELNDPHFRGGPGGVRGPVGNMFVSEQMDSHPHAESHGPYKVLRKHENERNADMEEDSWEQNIEKNDHPIPSFHKNERGPDIRRNEDMSSRRNMHTNQGYPSDPVTVHASQGPHKSKASNESWGNKSSFSEDSKDSTLIQKIEDLNAKARASDVRGDTEQINKLLINPKSNSAIAFGSISTTGDLAHPHDNSRQAHLGVRTRADHHTKGRLSNQDTDGWRKKPSFIGSEASAPENHITSETKYTGESLTQVVDPADGQAQRARMRELAKQRAIELQKEEEERIREQKAKAHAKLEELNRRTLAAADGTIQVAEKNNTSVSEQEDVDGSKKPTEPAIDSKAEVATQISEISQQDPVDQSMHSKQSDTESKATHGNDVGVNRPKRTSHRQKQSVQVVESTVDKSTLSMTGGEVITNPASSVAVSGEAVQSQESTQQKKRNNKSSRNKHKLDDASASRDVELVKPESPPLNPNPTTMTVTEDKDAKQPHADQISSLPSNQHKPQHSRRTPRNPQANRFHVGDVAVWAPVRPHNKEETMQDNMALPEKAINSGQTNLKSKRAEMERYVPKPVAKELAQQGTIIQSTSPSSPKKPTLEDMTDTQAIPTNLKSKRAEMERYVPKPVAKELAQQGTVIQSTSPSSPKKPTFEDMSDTHAIPVPSNVGPTKSGDNKQQQQVKPHGTSRQRNQQDSKKGFHKSTSQSDQSNPNPIPVSTETNVVHEWDPSDGWFMPDEYPPTEITPAPAPVVKDEGGITNKGKKPAYKGQRNTVKEVEVDQTDRPASSKKNRSSHWQPKPQPQAYKGGWSGGGQTAGVKRESRKYSQPDELVHDQGHQEGRRERKPASFRGRDQNQGYGNMEDEAQFDQQQQHHVSSGFRKYGGQNNNRSSGQDDKRKHNNYQQYANANREKPRQNMHYEYQPVGSTNNNNNNNNNNYNNNKSSHLDAHADAAPRYKERGSGQPRRGGGDFYGRNH
ncbi:protein MODIFIER OF SNC1 1-like [Bidens hawaiensis]|uniref:protein MODIFIER OF SNC1 1-like n=1 Tax=Bidens hawaiensis TaxID=980011 RepID=UPI00404AB613